MANRLLSPEDIDSRLSRCVGKRVASIWKGHGTAIFLELGRLHRTAPVRGEKMRSRGDVTLTIEWSWRIEGPRSIVVGSFDSPRKIESKIRCLEAMRIETISITGRLPELYVAFSDNRWLHSFATEAGQPEWALLFRGDGALFVERGRARWARFKEERSDA